MLCLGKVEGVIMNNELNILVGIFLIFNIYRIIMAKTKLIFKLITLALVVIIALFCGEITIFVGVLVIRLILHFFLESKNCEN